jgi:hypothetical protein
MRRMGAVLHLRGVVRCGMWRNAACGARAQGAFAYYAMMKTTVGPVLSPQHIAAR